MTKQIERAYRSNRRRSWVLIAAVVALAAAIAVPIASGAADKNYTLLFPSPATSPAAKAATSTNQTLCAGSAYSVSVTLKNTAKTVSLGSANITFPTNVTLSGSPTVVSDTAGFTLPAAANATLTGNLVKLRELSLPKGKQLKLTVSLTSASAPAASAAFAAIVKQSNDFNDSGGGANTFDPAAMPTVTVASCVATIKGQIWNDSNESGAKDSFESLQRPGSAAPNNVSVVLFENGVQVPTTTPPAGTGVGLSYDDSGYTFSNVPTGRNYVVCEVAGTGTWKQTTGSSQGACGSALPNGWAITLNGDEVGKNFGNANAVAVNCADAGSLSPPPVVSGGTRYTVKISGGCKNGSFVLEAYAPDTVQRVANFHPVGSGPLTKIYVIEKMEWSFTGTGQPDPAGRSLKYDDDPSNGINPVPMQYCVKDPRGADPWTLVGDLTTGILPGIDGTETSCLLTSTEKADGTYRREDWIFSSVDGYRLGP